MKIMIIGASGLIGESLVKSFSAKHEVIAADIEPLDGKTQKLDITDVLSLRKFILDNKPRALLFPAANPNVDGCEENPLKCEPVNITGPQNAAAAAKECGAKFVFFSSDYVFDGKNGPYDESATPNPVSEYGREKLSVEEFISKNIKDYIIIRTTVVYGPEKRGKNFVLSLIKRLRAGEKFKIPADQIGTPAYSPDIAGAVVKLVEKGAAGIFNVAGPELVGRMRFAELACDVFGLNRQLLVPVKTVELGQKAKRPLNAGLKIDKLLSTVPVTMNGPEEGLKKLRMELN